MQEESDRLAERELDEGREAKSVIYKMLPAVGMHGRGFSQEALIRGCYLIGADPWDWTDHPDVLEKRLALLPKRYRKKFERRGVDGGDGNEALRANRRAVLPEEDFGVVSEEGTAE